MVNGFRLRVAPGKSDLDTGFEVIERELERGPDVVPHGIACCRAFPAFEGVENARMLFAGHRKPHGIVDAAVGEEDPRLDVAFLDGPSERRVAGTEQDGFVKCEVRIEEFVHGRRLELGFTAVEHALIECLHDAQMFAEQFQMPG